MTENACWREATVPRFDVDLNGTGSMVCEEHRLALDLGEAAEELDMNLDAMREFLAEWADKVEELQEGGWRVREILYRRREELEREYLELSVKSRAAWRVADRRPDEEPLDLEEVERVEAQMTRADALSNALGILEQLPRESYGQTADRWAIAAVIGSIERHPDDEAEASRQRLSAEARRRSQPAKPA